MLRPRIPANPQPPAHRHPVALPGITAPLIAHPPVTLVHGTDCTCQHAPVGASPGSAPASVPVPQVQRPARPVMQLTSGAVVSGVAVVLVVGTVLVSLLLAVAVTAVSVAVCSVVLALLLRWLRQTNTDR